ncbi:NADH kinase pos5 [Linnemannia elongata]|nr:NADH kinase pos5 [Linnemannia elongata]
MSMHRSHSRGDIEKKPLDRYGELDQDLDYSGDRTLGRKGGFNAGSGGTRKLTSSLPTKVKMTLDTPGVYPKSLAPIYDKEPSREIRQSFGTTYGGNYKLHWEEGPRTILIIKKPNDDLTDKALVDVASWIHTKYPHTNIVVEPDVADAFADSLPFVYTIPEGKRVEYTRVTDLVITLGGDGTILHTSSLFNSAVPPVISFSMGTLGFLLPYHINNYQTALAKLIENQNASLLLRMRLKCTLHGPDGRRLQAKDGSGRINDLTIGEKSRGPAEVSLDGKETFFLDKNEFLQVCMSPFPMPCVNRVHAGEDWMKDINDLLKWNQSFHNKQSMSHYISE